MGCQEPQHGKALSATDTNTLHTARRGDSESTEGDSKSSTAMLNNGQQTTEANGGNGSDTEKGSIHGDDGSSEPQSPKPQSASCFDDDGLYFEAIVKSNSESAASGSHGGLSDFFNSRWGKQGKYKSLCPCCVEGPPQRRKRQRFAEPDLVMGGAETKFEGRVDNSSTFDKDLQRWVSVPSGRIRRMMSNTTYFGVQGGAASPKYSESERTERPDQPKEPSRNASTSDAVDTQPPKPILKATMDDITDESGDTPAQQGEVTSGKNEVDIKPQAYLTLCDVTGRGANVPSAMAAQRESLLSVTPSPEGDDVDVGVDSATEEGNSEVRELSSAGNILPTMTTVETGSRIPADIFVAKDQSEPAAKEQPTPAPRAQIAKQNGSGVKKTFTLISRCDQPDHVDGEDQDSNKVPRPPEVSQLRWSMLQKQHQLAVAEAYKLILRSRKRANAWANLTKRQRGRIRKARRTLSFVVDSGANVHTVTDDCSFVPGSTSPSGVNINGLSSSIEATEKGTISGSVRVDADGSKVLHFTDVHECSGSNMNLLSASLLTRDGISFIVEDEEDAFLLLPPDNEGKRKKIQLRYYQGLYLLDVEELYSADHDDMYEAFLSCAQLEERREAQYESSADDQGSKHAYSVAADLKVWHDRLGHVSSDSVRLIYRSGAVDDFEVEGLDDDQQFNGHALDCKCDTCLMVKNVKKHMPQRPRPIDHETMHPFQTVSADVKVIGTPSHAGNLYFVVFVDYYTRHCTAYFLEKKSECARAFADYLAMVSGIGYNVKNILTDSGGEFWSRHALSGVLEPDVELLAEFDKVCKVNASGRVINHISTPAYHSDMNPVAERYIKKICDVSNCMLYHARLGTIFWQLAVSHAVYLINRVPLKFHVRHHQSKSATECATRVRPSYSRLRVFGCDAFERLHGKQPLSSEPGAPNSRKLLYVGVSADEKSFLCYDIEADKIRRAFDLRFNESMLNRVNHLREYDARRKLSSDERPKLYDEWADGDDTARDGARKLYDLYDLDARHVEKNGTNNSRSSVGADQTTQASENGDSEGDSTTGTDVPTALESAGAGPGAELISTPKPAPQSAGADAPKTAGAHKDKCPSMSSSKSDTSSSPCGPSHGAQGGEEVDKPAQGSDRRPKEKYSTSAPEDIRDHDYADDSEIESDDDDDPTDDDFSDVSDDDFTEEVQRRRSIPRRAKRSKNDLVSQRPFRESFPKARRHGPLTERRLQELHHKSQVEVEPAHLVRPPRFKKVGDYDKGRPDSLRKQDRLFLRAAFEHNYRIVVDQTHKKSGFSAARWKRVQPATSTQHYLELAVANIDPNDASKVRAALKKAREDFKYEFDRGLIKFPDRESDHHSHYCDAEELAQLHGCVRVAELISSMQVNHIANSATLSFHQILDTIAGVEEAIDWIETKERMQRFGMESFEVFQSRAAVDLSANLDSRGMEPPYLDASTHITPTNYRGVTRSKDREQWERAMQEEIDNLTKMGTWEHIPVGMLPPGADLVDCKFVYKIKSGPDGQITRWRARAVARGFTQRPGVDYNEEEVYAPVVSYDTFRTCLSIAAATDAEILQADIKNAYLVGELDRPIYMRQPPSGCMVKDEFGRPMICKLARPIYGLKQSGHIFANVLHGFLEGLGMKRLVSDRCVFIKESAGWAADSDVPSLEKGASLNPNGGQLIVLTYVDDLTIIGSPSETQGLMDALRKRFTLQEAETGDASYMLSMEVKRNREARSLTINQEAAIKKIATGLGISVEKPSVRTPMKEAPLVKLEEPEEDPVVKSFGYLNAVGSLLHVAQCTRPDISFAVGALARHSTTVGKEHVSAVKRVVQYLYNTRRMCIKYQPDGAQPNEPVVYEATGRKVPVPEDVDISKQEIEAFADADYAMDPSTRRSTSGGIILLNNGPISWSSRLQKIVAQSTAEAEIMAATEITKEIVHARLLLSELGVRSDGPVRVREDNQACILMGKGMKNSRSAKHYEVRLHFLQQSIHDGVIEFEYCDTNEMLADALTKPLGVDKFEYFRHMMLHEPLDVGVKIGERRYHETSSHA